MRTISKALLTAFLITGVISTATPPPNNTEIVRSMDAPPGPPAPGTGTGTGTGAGTGAPAPAPSPSPTPGPPLPPGGATPPGGSTSGPGGQPTPPSDPGSEQPPKQGGSENHNTNGTSTETNEGTKKKNNITGSNGITVTKQNDTYNVSLDEPTRNKLGIIDTNTRDINDLKGKVSTNESSINTNSGKIKENSTEISSIKSNIDSNTSMLNNKANLDATNITGDYVDKWRAALKITDTQGVSENEVNSIITKKTSNDPITETDGTKLVNVKGLKDYVEHNNQNISKLLQGTNAGIASSNAIAGIPQVGYTKKVALGAGVGYYGKSYAVAVGLSGHTKSNSIIYKLAASVNSQKQFGLSTGISLGIGEYNNTTKETSKNTLQDKVQDNTQDNTQENVQSSIPNTTTDTNRIKDLEDKLQQANSKIEKLYNMIKNISNSRINDYRLVIDNIKTNEYRLTNSQKEVLINNIDKFKNANQINITGYASTKGHEKYNLDLGLKRAMSVQRFLISQGVDKAKIFVSSSGYNNIVSSDNQKLNRRIVINVK